MAKKLIYLACRHGNRLTSVLLAVLVFAQQMYFRHELSILRTAGPIGYQLLNGRRWVMSPAVASGRGREGLKKLENLPLADNESEPVRSGTNLPWGRRCWKPSNPHVLVAVPYNPAMPEALQQNLIDVLSRLECVYNYF